MIRTSYRDAHRDAHRPNVQRQFFTNSTLSLFVRAAMHKVLAARMSRLSIRFTILVRLLMIIIHVQARPHPRYAPRARRFWFLAATKLGLVPGSGREIFLAVLQAVSLSVCSNFACEGICCCSYALPCNTNDSTSPIATFASPLPINAAIPRHAPRTYFPSIAPSAVAAFV